MNGDRTDKVREHRVLDLFLLLFNWRKIILGVTLVAMLLGLALAFIVKREYKSIARVLPPKESNILSGLSGLSGLVRSLPGGLGRIGKVEDPYDYVAILRSRTVMEEIINTFDLIRVYDISDNSMEKALKKLKNNSEIDWTEENTLEIRVWDVDANRAADIANYYVAMLNRRSYELQTREARNTRLFIEQRVLQNREELTKAEETLKQYQEKEKMIVPVDPSAAGMSSIAELYTLKVKKEIELGILSRTVGLDHPQYRQVQLELQTIIGKVSRFPEIGIESLRLYREIAIQQKILELLVPLYEQAKVNEHKDVPVAYILDPGVPGERPDRPKRIFVVGIATFLGLVLSVVILSYKEYASHLKTNAPEKWERVLSIRKALRLVKKDDGHGG